METKLNKCKDVARLYLHSDIEPTPIPIIVTHPIFDTAIFPSYKDKSSFVNIIEDEDERNFLLSKYEIKIETAKTIRDLFAFIRSPYRMQFFSDICFCLSEKDFAEMLVFSWVTDEYANANEVVDIEDILYFFKKAKKEYMMDKEELDAYQKLPQKVKIYRGVTSYNKTNKKAMSWTLSKEKADWFAHRFDENGEVLEKEVDKQYILAYLKTRNEDEVIVDYNVL